MRAQNGSTTLILAADNGHTGFVRLLLDAGADKDAKNNVRGQSAVSAVARVCVLRKGLFLFLFEIEDERRGIGWMHAVS